jgi:hypothetical protein
MADIENPQDEQDPQDEAEAPASVVDELNSTEKPPLLKDTDEARLLLTIIQDYERQEQFVRLSSVKKWRKQIHYWNNLQYLAWSESAHDWRTAEDILAENPQADIDPALYAKVINIYKAHGEILIGALTSGLPGVRFFPKDADDHEDVQTAKAYSKIAELIAKHNKAKLLLMKALFILYNQGMVACYNENKDDFKFGTIRYPIMSDVPIVHRQDLCPACGADLSDGDFSPDQPPQEAPIECPQCGQTVIPEHQDTQGTTQQQTGVGEKPKNREVLDIFGPLNVKIPMWVKDQSQTPILTLETEEHVGFVREIYPELFSEIQATSYPDSFDKESRIPSHYKNDFPRDIVTVGRTWLRPWAMNMFTKDEAESEALKKKYPDGCYVVVLNKTIVAEVIPDKLDDHWTISQNPLSESIHAEPIGATIIPIQEMTNELANLTLDTIEFGISEVFVESEVLDTDEYQMQEARPGQITPVTSRSGKSLSESFYESKPASLSREVELFADRLEQTAQFVQGSYPSVYGGSQEGGSKTAREYELSKSSALQRLSTTWTIVQEWWALCMSRSIKSFVKNMQEDERFVKAQGNNFVNVWIKKIDLSGEVGDIEPEVSETFPISWAQKRDVMMGLIQMQNEDVATVIRHPENAGLVAQLIGVPELYIPGDDSRNKQLYEIAEMLDAQPSEGMPDPETGIPQMISTVEVDQDVDDHNVEAEICKSWLRSEVGLDAKVNNPPGYMNVLAHLKEHLYYIRENLIVQQQQQMDAAAGPQDGENITDKGVSNGPPA